MISNSVEYPVVGYSKLKCENLVIIPLLSSSVYPQPQ